MDFIETTVKFYRLARVGLATSSRRSNLVYVREKPAAPEEFSLSCGSPLRVESTSQLRSQFVNLGSDLDSRSESAPDDQSDDELALASVKAADAAALAPCMHCGCRFAASYDDGVTFQCFECHHRLENPSRCEAELAALKAAKHLDDVSAVMQAEQVQRVRSKSSNASEKKLPHLARRASDVAALAPCVHCGCRFAKSYDDGVTFQCFECHNSLDDPSRCAAELAALRAAKNQDVPAVVQAAESAHRVKSKQNLKLSDDEDAVTMSRVETWHQGCDAPPRSRVLRRGVRMSWLKHFAIECAGLTSAQVVLRKVKPMTERTRCRFVELRGMVSAVGKAEFFVSHAWAAIFSETVGATSHVLPDESFVWLDIFAVRQWPGNVADLKFESLVHDTRALILVAPHLPSVANITEYAIERGQAKLPSEALQCVPFFRVWCLLELAAAMHLERPVVMLIGGVCQDGKFQPDISMCRGLYGLVDVQKARATVERDRERILFQVRTSVGFAAVNSLCRGAISGAEEAMLETEVLKAACGIMEPLRTMPEVHRPQALRAAAAGGFQEALTTLIALNTPVDLADSRGRTALMCAADGGHSSTIEKLLQADADVDAQDFLGHTALIHAARGEHLKATRVLLAAAAAVDIHDYSGMTALAWSAENNHPVVVPLLLSSMANIEAMDQKGRRPLMFAARTGNVAVIQKLAASGAHVNAVNDKGGTALMYAVRGGHLPAVESLLAFNAVRLSALPTHFHAGALRAAAKGGFLELLTDLLATGIHLDINAPGDGGRTALMQAAEYGRLETARALLEARATHDTSDQQGRTAMSLAAEGGHVVVMELLAACRHT